MSEAWRRRLFLWALLGPTVAVVLAVVAYPFVYNVVLSLSNMNLYHIRDWEVIGLQQYAAVFSEAEVWGVFVKTVIWTLVNIVFHVGIGVWLAVILNKAFIVGKPLWRVLLILPWALPQYITALTWRGMFNYEYGAVNLLMTKYLGMSPMAWLTSPFEAFVAVILTNIWLGFPFMMVVALGGLQSIPGELYEAADVDGAASGEVLDDHGAAAPPGDDPGDHARHRVDVQQHQRRLARHERRRAERPDAHPSLVRLRGGVLDVPVRVGGGALDGDLRHPLPVHAGVPQEDERDGGGVLMAKPNSASPWSMIGAYAVLAVVRVPRGLPDHADHHDLAAPERPAALDLARFHSGRRDAR
jgi:ABC-type spermidine/putrescine transport system permease subunit I